DQVAPGTNPERGRGSRLVEGAGLRDSPVEQDGLLVFVTQPDAADVTLGVFAFVCVCVAVTVFAVTAELDATERESLGHLAQLRNSVLIEPGEGVAFAAGLVVATDLQRPDCFE